MKRELISGNKLIAEFMGFTPRTDLHTEGALFMQAPITGDATHSSCYIVNKDDDKYDEFNELQYREDWDWLMPVVEKIEDLRNEVCIYETSCRINTRDGEYSESSNDMVNCSFDVLLDGETKIEAVWLAVIKFIEYFNNK